MTPWQPQGGFRFFPRKKSSETKEEIPDELEAAVRLHVKRVYEKYDRNLTHTAEALKAARNTVKKYLEEN